jgi:hypothetical protein
MHPPFLRPRTVSEILDGSIQLMRRHYVPITAATGLLLLPSLLLAALLPPGMERLVDFVENVFLNFAAAATVLMVADVALGREPDMHGALRQVRGKAWMILGAAILQGLAIGFGMLLLIIPGFIAMALLFAVPIVVMVEDRKNVSEVMSRSASLARGDMLRVLGATLLALLVIVVAGIGLGLLVAFAPGLGERQADLLSRTLLIFLYPFPSVVSTLLYFDLRIRKEGFGLDDLASVHGPEVPRYGPAGY